MILNTAGNAHSSTKFLFLSLCPGTVFFFLSRNNCRLSLLTLHALYIHINLLGCISHIPILFINITFYMRLPGRAHPCLPKSTSLSLRPNIYVYNAPKVCLSSFVIAKDKLTRNIIHRKLRHFQQELITKLIISIESNTTTLCYFFELILKNRRNMLFYAAT